MSPPTETVSLCAVCARSSLFTDCNEVLMGKLGELSDGKAETDMETLFCSVSLDIIGKAVFNYDFGCVHEWRFSCVLQLVKISEIERAWCC